MNESPIPVKEISELLDSVSDKIPRLIKGLIGTLYNADAGRDMGQAVGNFYKELVSSGIPPETALVMAKDYMLSLKDISSMMNKPGE